MVRRFDGDRIVIASHNAGKVREIGELLAPFGVSVSSASDFGLSEPDETEATFAGNARIKAHSVVQATGLPALSDDSGLSVAALGDAPGVYTADWAETGQGRDFAMAMARVWSECVASGEPEPYRALFACTLCLAWPDGHDEIFAGEVHGTLAWPMRGKHGFGFDPMFVPDGWTETFGEMDPAQKQDMSHRARAVARLVEACFAN